MTLRDGAAAVLAAHDKSVQFCGKGCARGVCQRRNGHDHECTSDTMLARMSDGTDRTRLVFEHATAMASGLMAAFGAIEAAEAGATQPRDALPIEKRIEDIARERDEAWRQYHDAIDKHDELCARIASQDATIRAVLAALYDATGDGQTYDEATLGKRVAALAKARDEAMANLDDMRADRDRRRLFECGMHGPKECPTICDECNQAHIERVASARDAAMAEADRLRAELGAFAKLDCARPVYDVTDDGRVVTIVRCGKCDACRARASLAIDEAAEGT